jgi:UDP-N-acetylglucosamine--N-acetylmuramyl-(pentapeptide) pyrophosphoryl-undecaprenol N-acetylglucosamine transferase
MAAASAIKHDDPDPGGMRCVIAGGGTGGHLFPGIAVAREIEGRFEGADILFVVGRKRMESEILSRHGFRVAPIQVEGIKGRGLKKGLGVMVRLPISLIESLNILRAFSPRFVLGMGGYSAGPVCVAARLMGTPTAVHEQNAYPGLTNRLLCRVVDRVFISFEESRDHFKGGALFVTGHPVRKDLLRERGPIPEGGPLTVLVVGGSQGARAINEVFVDAVLVLKERGVTLEVIHQTGKPDFERVVRAYEVRALKAEVLPFIEDMAGAYQRAHMVVGRAGASTIFELAALGMPSVLIPYPHAANQHQETNALTLVRAGGARMIRQDALTADDLAGTLKGYAEDREALVEMGKRARSVGRHDAAEVIVDHMVEMTE